MYDDEGSESGPKGTFETYKAEGDTLFKQGAYTKAIESFSTALELQPGEPNCLVCRSKCYLQLGDTEVALTDAEAALAEDKEFHKALYQKAEALYQKGEFEMSLVFYHRGHKLRPELQEFRLGIQKAQEAIDNSVGSPASVKLTKEGDLSFFSKQDEKVKPKRMGGYSKPGTRQQEKKKRQPPVSSASERTVKQLLGELYGDKLYLEKLLKETDQSTQSGQNIYELVCEGLQYLDTRTDFWRQQKPMYARKRDKKLQMQSRNTNKAGGLNQYVIKELEKIDQSLSQGLHERSLNQAIKCKKTVESYKEADIPNKDDILANLHSCIGNAYLEMGKYEQALENHQKDLSIANERNMDDAKSRALDNMGRVYARMGKYEKAIQLWLEKVPMSKSALESTWLFHEIGRCYLEMEKYGEAKDYGDRSLAAAQEAGDGVWQLNSSVLVAQAQMKLEDYSAALEAFERSLDLAKTQGDKGAEEAIRIAIEDVNSKIVQAVKEEEEEEAKEEESQGTEEVEKESEETEEEQGGEESTEQEETETES